MKGKHLSYQRGKRNTNPNVSLIKIEGVEDTNAAKYVFYSIPTSTHDHSEKERWTGLNAREAVMALAQPADRLGESWGVDLMG